MNSSSKSVLCLALLAWSALCAAQVYKYVDRDGVVHYSDEPSPGARAVELPEISVYPFRVPVPLTPNPPADKAAVEGTQPSNEEGRKLGEGFRIVEPENNATLAPSDGAVPVRILLEPGLEEDQSLALLLDGRPAKTIGSGLDLALPDVATGRSHTLEARVLDADGRQVRRTKSILFHIP